MNEFKIDLQPLGPVRDTPSPHGIRIAIGEAVLSRLIRTHDNKQGDYLFAPAEQLAFWLTDNWWRLRWESIPREGRTPAWRQAHDMSSIGGGYAWPKIAVIGGDDRLGLISIADSEPTVGPVRYLTNALQYINAGQFEREVDRFFERVLDDRILSADEQAALGAQIAALRRERVHPDYARWRMFEARLGFDPDQAPEAVICAALKLARQYGVSGTGEAMTAAPGLAAAKTLHDVIDAASKLRSRCDHVSDYVDRVTVERQPDAPPWVIAEKVAQDVRDVAGTDGGPLRNQRLAELLGVSASWLKAQSRAEGKPPYGLRLQHDDGRQSIVSRNNRRFDACRALGDAVWSSGGEDRIGPLADTKTLRQKFQRAFAQSLLCPYEDLRAYMNTERPDDDDITAAARYFHVSERMVQSILINKGIIQRDEFAERLEVA